MFFNPWATIVIYSNLAVMRKGIMEEKGFGFKIREFFQKLKSFICSRW